MPKTKVKTKKSIKNKPKFNKWLALAVTVIMAGIGSYILFFAKAAEPDQCTNTNHTVFTSGGCVQVIKNMVNVVSGSQLDTNNPGFDGPLNTQLSNMNSFGVFAACGGYNPQTGVTPCVYNALKDATIAKTTPAPTPTPNPTPTPTPTPAPVACKDQGLKKGSSGDCVKLLNASLNVVMKKCFNTTPNNSNGIFDDSTNITITQSVSGGHLGDEAKNTGFGGTVTPRLWDIIMFMTTQYNNGATCVRPQTATAPSSVPPATTTPSTAPGAGESACPNNTNHDLALADYIDGVNNKKLNYSLGCHALWLTYAKQKNELAVKQGTAKATPGIPPANLAANIDCAGENLKVGSKGDCVKKLKFYIVGLGADSAVVNPANNIFDKNFDNVLAFMINVQGMDTVPLGTYKNIVSREIWEGIYKAASNKVQSNANELAAKVRAEKIAATEAAKVKQKQDLEALGSLIANLQNGDPNFVFSGPVRTFEAKVFYDKSKKLSMHGPGDNVRTYGALGRCWIVIYPDYDNKSNWWTYSDYTNNGMGKCGNYIVDPLKKDPSYYVWKDTDAAKEGVSASGISNINRAKASTKAINGSAGGK